MKKYYSKFVTITMMVATFFLFACSSNDEDDNSGMPSLSPSGKRLVRVTENNIILDYTYDNKGRVSQIIERNNYDQTYRSVVRSYSYDENTITEMEFYSNYSFKNIYTLKNGRIIEIYMDYKKETVKYDYQNGYIITETEPDRVIQYNWKDGNLMTVDSGTGLLTFEYSEYKCPQGFYPFGRHNAHICESWGMSGYLGKSMKNLPSYYSDGHYVERYDWTVVDDTPIKMVYNGKTVYTFEWE